MTFRNIKLVCLLAILLKIMHGTFSKDDVQNDLFPEDRIVGGENANQDDWNFIVSLQKYGAHSCGGSFLTKDCIITAAHCVNKKGKVVHISVVSIKAGTLDVDSKKAIVVKAKKIIVYPEYDPITDKHDLALVKLANTVESPLVGTIQIKRSETLPGTKCVTAGWGHTESKRMLASRRNMTFENFSKSPRKKKAQEIKKRGPLQEVTLPVMNETVCKNKFSQLGENITWTLLCTLVSEGGKDACQGDSGGPLVCDNKLAGLTSFGIGCARRNIPAAFTNVSNYAVWIEQLGCSPPATDTPAIRTTTIKILIPTTRPKSTNIKKKPIVAYSGPSLADNRSLAAGGLAGNGPDDVSGANFHRSVNFVWINYLFSICFLVLIL